MVMGVGMAKAIPVSPGDSNLTQLPPHSLSEGQGTAHPL